MGFALARTIVGGNQLLLLRGCWGHFLERGDGRIQNDKIVATSLGRRHRLQYTYRLGGRLGSDVSVPISQGAYGLAQPGHG